MPYQCLGSAATLLHIDEVQELVNAGRLDAPTSLCHLNLEADHVTSLEGLQAMTQLRYAHGH